MSVRPPGHIGSDIGHVWLSVKLQHSRSLVNLTLHFSALLQSRWACSRGEGGLLPPLPAFCLLNWHVLPAGLLNWASKSCLGKEHSVTQAGKGVSGRKPSVEVTHTPYLQESRLVFLTCTESKKGQQEWCTPKRITGSCQHTQREQYKWTSRGRNPLCQNPLGVYYSCNYFLNF